MKSATFAAISLALVQLPLSPVSATEEATRLGERIEAVRRAIDCPDCPGSMAAVVDLGTDSRYYVMTRGWLLERLRADRSVLDAAGDAAPPHLAARVEFLQQAIRRIDLE